MSREELAARQAELLEALLSDGAAPSGFDAERLRVEAGALRDKRRRLVAYLRPDLPESLAERFGPLFDVYATDHPKTTEIRARDYADAFAAWLVSRGELPKPRRRWFRR
ncbi:hypothetical protein [Amycolatopsis panacis]|uniref:SCO6045-like C-terminal domain-containing protein n=1 Tax=Amycolatopsis panacis TaxID=2340917 RepID=A0A419I4B1_9PSEU|nr:hypothetical protein [Amycolatopsis panacis]RJQ85232.1 hypothetical protein D5S19_14635 [Amycolatopsis panacis]